MKRRYFKRKRTFRRRRPFRKSQSRKYAKKQQKSAFTYLRKKYTRVFIMEAVDANNSAEVTISHFAGRNAHNPDETITLVQCGQDGQLFEDMKQHQYFKITGVGYKLIFSPPTDTANTPVQWTATYSASKIIAPDLQPQRLQTLATYQTGGCDPTKPISRYFKTWKAIKRFGIDWAECRSYQILDVSPPVDTYNGQLPVDNGSSSQIRVYRSDTEVD